MNGINIIKSVIKSFPYVLLFILNENILHSQLRISGEILPGAYDIGDDDEWYVSCETISGTIWWWNDHKITTQHGTDQTENFEGNGVCSGFHACDDWQPTSEPVVSYGYYKFTFHFPSPVDNKIVYLDLRDADWSEHYSGSPDLYIRWNDSTGYFEYKNSLTENEYPKYKWAELGNSGTVATIWELFEHSDPNQEAFQPTPPQNFHCTNAYGSHQHPQFEWETPEEPDGVTFYYSIYRDLGAGYKKINGSSLTDTTFIDTGIEIIRFGSNTAHYYVTAKGSESPESDASNIVDIMTNSAEKMMSEKDMPEIMEADSVELPQIRLLGNYPNPFNSMTMIQYSIPQASQVTLEIINLHGEMVKKLADGYQTANHYQVIWNGENEVGEKVASGIYLGQLRTDNDSQIKRIIYIK